MSKGAAAWEDRTGFDVRRLSLRRVEGGATALTGAGAALRREPLPPRALLAAVVVVTLIHSGTRPRRRPPGSSTR